MISKQILLITSAAHIGQELAIEFGLMPPAFLPVGNRRLYEYQIERVGTGREIYLSVPESYTIPMEDKQRLATRGVNILYLPETLSLGESIVFALNLIGIANAPVAILHGDTLIDELPANDSDVIAVATGEDSYSWAEVQLSGEKIIDIKTVPAGATTIAENPIVCGYFSFTHSSALVRSITRARGNFISGILDYGRDYPLKAVSVLSWYDFGHVQTYFRSRRMVTTTRHFNSLQIDGRTAKKNSLDRAKITAEAEWLATVPPSIQIYCARLIDSGNDDTGKAFYETEYEHLPTLSELLVFGSLNRPVWTRIIRSCKEFLVACADKKCCDSGDVYLTELSKCKTESRLREFARQTNFDINAPLRFNGELCVSLLEIAEKIYMHIDFASGRMANVMHGDFCFSNILYDSRVQRICVIDPRGYVESQTPTIYGDLRYDLAKLAHSVFGRYDEIIAGRYSLEVDAGHNFRIAFELRPHYDWLEQELNGLEVDGVRADSLEVQAITIGLFLSMLPLHSDRPDRQNAFIANALRLYSSLGTRGT